jgi:hypothetical protein
MACRINWNQEIGDRGMTKQEQKTKSNEAGKMELPPFSNLPSLAQELRNLLPENDRKFILLYAHNGIGKTRLSEAFKNTWKEINKEDEPVQRDTLYFNAFTEDLFIWNNDLDGDRDRVLMLNEKSRFFDGLAFHEFETPIRELISRYVDFDFKIHSKINKNEKLTEAKVIFHRKENKTDDSSQEDIYGIKISRGEERIFIWCFFLAILQLALLGDETYKWVKYVYIDDPISSLDEHNVIQVGNHLVQLYKDASRCVPTVISTHHALFFNVLFYGIKGQFERPKKYLLKRDKLSEQYCLKEQKGDTPQFYHVSALEELWELQKKENIKTYHFNVLRSILEKIAFFLGYDHFSKVIKKDEKDTEGTLHQSFVDQLSHGKHSVFEPEYMQEQDLGYFRAIFQDLIKRFSFNTELFP